MVIPLNNNKLIAEFMGFTYDKNIGWHDNTMLMPQCVYDNQDGNCFDELLFNISWDWLMPAVNKCYTSNMQHPNDDITQGLIDVDIKATYQAVVEFIQEYNNKKENEDD